MQKAFKERTKKRRSFAVFGCFVALVLVCACTFSPRPAVAAEHGFFSGIAEQIGHVFSLALETAGRVFSGEVFQLAQLGGNETVLSPEEIAALGVPVSITTATANAGTLVINAPLLIDTNLSISGFSTLATTTVIGLLTVNDLVLETLSVGGTANFGSFVAAGAGTITGPLTASGGITTGGATIDLEGGQIFASNVVNEIIAGDFVRIGGTANAPEISVDLDTLEVVTSINGDSGDLDLRGRDDIRVRGTTIYNESTLETVTDRGGCSNCILDNDVVDTLTIAGGAIDNTIIGATTPAAGYFTNVRVGATSTPATLTIFGGVTTVGGATSTFDGGVNITDGCFAVNGVCVAGGAPASYVSLIDTPASLIAGALQFVNASGTALTQSGDFTYVNGDLALGTSSARTRFTVDGDQSLLSQSALRFYTNSNDAYVAFRASSTLATSTTWTLPVADGGANEILVTDGAGSLRFADISSVGGGASTYLELTDTPSSFATSAIPFVNALGTALTQDADFVFSGGNLGVGTSTPGSRLTVVGNSAFTGDFSVFNTATATFSSSINLTSGCVALNGDCINDVDALDELGDVTITAPQNGETLQYNGTAWVNVAISALGFGDGTYVGLTDTPNTLIAGALQFANATSSGLTQSANLVFSNNRLSVGTSSSPTTFGVSGDASLLSRSALRFYSNSNSRYVGFRASTTLATSTTWTLPTADGTGNQVLVTDGSGNLRFADVSAIGGGATTYLGLTDTPSSYIAGAIQYVNATSSRLVQSTNLVFTGTNLGIGVAVPTSRLSVSGSVRFFESGGSPGFVYNNVTNTLTLGSATSTDRFTVLGGSIDQRGGNSSATYLPQLVGGLNMGETANDLEVVGKYAFVITGSTGNDFHVIDISSPATPVQVASINLAADAQTITVRGRYAYIGLTFTGNEFVVVDIGNPLAPVVVGGANLPTGINDVEVQGRYAYVVTDSIADEFHVIDLIDPAVPVVVESISIDGDARGVAIQGNYAYVTSDVLNNDVHVIDISNPLSVSEVGSLNLPDGAQKIVVSGRYAYVSTDGVGNNFYVINIASPTAPAQVAALDLPANARGMALGGDYVYITTLAGGDDLQVIDVSVPASPRLVGGVDPAAGDAYNVVLSGRYAYFVTSSGGQDFHVYDISGARLQSAIVGALNTGSLSLAGDGVVSGRLRVSGSLGVGQGGIQTDGALVAFGTNSSYIEGSLGIGTTSTSSKLTVDGSIKAANLLGGATNLTTDANGVIIRDPSDERLKEDIVPIENALALVTELRGVRYEWRDKSRFGEQIEIGFIAQEVDLVLPEVVQKGGEYWSLNKSNIVAVVVEAIKELYTLVTGQGEQIEALEARVRELEAAAGVTPPPPSSTPEVPPTEDGNQTGGEASADPEPEPEPEAPTEPMPPEPEPTEQPLEEVVSEPAPESADPETNGDQETAGGDVSTESAP